MKRLLLSLLFATGCFAAGSVQQTLTQLGTSDSWVLTFRWIGDSVDGSVPVTPGKGLNTIQGYVATAVQVVPGTPSPTALYSVTLPDGSGIDILGGAATSLSPTIAASFTPSGATVPLQGAVSLTVTGQGVPSARGAVTIYFVKPSAFTIAQPTGATNVNWITQVSNKPFVDVRSFGAKGDGLTDDTAAIQAAINSMLGTGLEGSGGTLYLPTGVWRITDRLIITNRYVHILGAGRMSTVILSDSATADAVDFLFEGYDGISSLTIKAGVGKTAGYAVRLLGGAYNILQDMNFEGMPNGVLVDTGSIVNTIQNVDMRDLRPGTGVGIDVQQAAINILNVSEYNGHDTQHLAGIRIGNSGGLTVDDFSVGEAINGFLANPSGGGDFLNQIMVRNSFFDHCNIGINISPSNGKSANGITFVGIDASSDYQYGAIFQPSDTATISNVKIADSTIALSGISGVFVRGGANTTNIMLANNEIRDSSQVSPSAGHDIHLDSGATKISITGNILGNVNPTENYNVFIVNGLTNSLILGNQMEYHIAGGVAITGDTTGTTIANNPGFNPNGSTSYDCSAHGGSPCTIPIGPMQTTVSVMGGTISAMTVNGTLIATSTSKNVTVPPNASVIVTYSVLPTITSIVF